jgi:hypothetical protein
MEAVVMTIVVEGAALRQTPVPVVCGSDDLILALPPPFKLDIMTGVEPRMSVTGLGE